jgi:YVTN family beta-propeller protein
MRSRLIATAIAIAVGLMTMTLRAAPGQSFVYVAPTSDPIAAPELLVIDAATMAVVTRIPLPANSGQRGMAMAPDGRRLYVRSNDWLVVVDTTTHSVIQTIGLSRSTGISHLAVSSDSTTIYLSARGEAGSTLEEVKVSTAVSRTLGGYDAMTADVAASHTTPRLFVIGHAPLTNLLVDRLDEYDAQTSARLSSTNTQRATSSPLAISQDGARLYFNLCGAVFSPCANTDLAVVSAGGKQALGVFRGGGAQRIHAGVAGKYVYVNVAGSPATIRTFDATTLNTSAILEAGVTAPAVNLVASEDESLIFVATASGTVIQSSPPKTQFVNRVEVLDRTNGRLLSTIALPDSIHSVPATDRHYLESDGVTPMAVTFPGTPRCSYRLSTTFSSWSTAGGTGSVTLTSPCSWVASTDAPWIHLQQTSGSTGATINFTVDPATTSAGRSATMTIAGQLVTVSQAGSGQNPPYGLFELPVNGSVLSGSVVVTGWTLDDVGVTGVQIWRDAHPSDPAAAIHDGRVFVGAGTFVDGARPDVAAAFPQAPQNTRAGWGYLMLTRGLVWDGKGAFNLYAYATDVEGNFTLLGSKTVTVNNFGATKPFGAIDTPAPAATISGFYGVTGWVLTPNAGATIPASGVRVAIDGVFLPDVPSMSNRSDITNGFPGFNTTGAGRGVVIDTTKYADGLHTIGFLVTDSTGQSDGVGGRFFTIDNSSARLSSGTFSETGSPAGIRYGHTATQLVDGRILITGGQGENGCDPVCGYPRIAEIYDPAKGSFTTVGKMSTGRYMAAAALLPNGRVLIAGGYNYDNGANSYLTTAEIFDPATATFSPTGAMNLGRTGHSATVLANGTVLIAGGSNGQQLTATAEIYDPATGVFTMTAPMPAVHLEHTATRLSDGRVLIAGGYGPAGYTSRAELYNPALGTFTSAGTMTSIRYAHTATALDNGTVLIAGGNSGAVPAALTASAELFDPTTDTFSLTGSMIVARYYHTATRTASGQVLIAGGDTNGQLNLSSAEIYDPSTGVFRLIAPMQSGRARHTASVLPDGSILLAGGVRTAERFVEDKTPE